MYMHLRTSVKNIKSNATNWFHNFTSEHLPVNKPIQRAGKSLKNNNSDFSLLNNSLHLHCIHQTLHIFLQM